MKTKIFLWVLAMLASTALQGAILVWLYSVNQILFWVSLTLWTAAAAVFACFVFIAGVKETKEYLKDYWSLTLSA